jgi:hypothetical protein
MKEENEREEREDEKKGCISICLILVCDELLVCLIPW